MSLNQAFQTAVAYRQGMIDRNMDAAAQAPMLAIQALNVGLQAQAQSQQAQFQMQSMVLGTQLQIEETKAKQAMQVMEFDFAQRKFAADQEQAKMDYDLRKQSLAAYLDANALRVQQAKNEMAIARNNQLADTFIGMQYAKGLTEEQLVLGANPEGMAEFAQSYPEAAAVLGSRLNAVRESARSNLAGQIDAMRLARSKTVYDSRLSLGERAMAAQDFASQLQPMENKLAILENRAPRDMADNTIMSKLAAFKGANTLDVKTRLDLLDAARKEEEIGTPEGLARAEALRQEANGVVPGEPGQTPEDAAAAVRASLLAQKTKEQQTAQAQAKLPANQVAENRQAAAKVAALDKWEGDARNGGTAAANALDRVANTSSDAGAISEARRLKSVLTAAVQATRMQAQGGKAVAFRQKTPDESVTPASTLFPMAGVSAGAMPAAMRAPTSEGQVRALTQDEMDAIALNPSFENVKRILSRLEVK